jgi:hypothetical protein
VRIVCGSEGQTYIHTRTHREKRERERRERGEGEREERERVAVSVVSASSVYELSRSRDWPRRNPRRDHCGGQALHCGLRRDHCERRDHCGGHALRPTERARVSTDERNPKRSSMPGRRDEVDLVENISARGEG